MKRSFFLIFASSVVLATSSCQNDVDSQSALDQNVDSSEYEILSLVFDQALGSDTLAVLSRVPPPMDQELDSAIINEYYRYTDSLVGSLDSIPFKVLVGRAKSRPNELPRIDMYLTPAIFSENFLGADTLFIPLLSELSKTNVADTVNVLKIKSKYRYALISEMDLMQETYSTFRGYKIRFSAIVYDDTKSRACVYTAFLCGSLCGSGTIYFLEKSNDRWRIVSERMMWIS